MRGSFFSCVCVVAACFCAGCPPPVEQPRSIFDSLLKHEEQRQALCARGRDNAVTAVFCGDDVDARGGPDVTSLAELQKLLSLSFDGSEPRPGFALTANSSSLVARSVSALNPRAILAELADQRADGNAIGLGYTRGDQLVEIATLPNAADGAEGGELAFYLLRYEQDCNDDDATAPCGPNELLTPATEEGWRRWSLYDDVDLKNTVVDCLQCHQPDGLSGQRLFRMQELQNPWTHWFAAFTDGGAVLLDDYRSAHGVDETYAGIPGRLIAQSNPILVEALVKRTVSDQINLFPSPDIEAEVVASSPGQPDDNSVPGQSDTWERLYDAAVRGEAIPPPYHDVKITDQRKLLDATAAYHAFVDDGVALDVDLRDVVDDDALRDLSFRPKAGLDGAGILLHACGQCHNARLDPTLTRARFDVTRLDAMTKEEKQRAIDRLRLDDDDPLLMPPRLFRSLSDDEIEQVVSFLR